LFRAAGDVKYHLGYSGDWTTHGGRKVHLSLCFNPSHLEFVDPVAVGRVRAKQDRSGDRKRQRGMALLIHGDAGFAGEGIVQETLNLSQLDGYSIGGALHVVVNNQLGFTTSPHEGRSTNYPTAVARMLQTPVFHVNGEHPEAVAQAVDLASDFRSRFRRDVVIDMFCYRRWGHNEGDEPSFTQPLMYEAIEHRESVRDGYLEHLLELGGVTRDEADQIAEERREELGRQFKQARNQEFQPASQSLGGVWQGYRGGEEPNDDPDTGVDGDLLRRLLVKMTETPDGFHRHKKLHRTVERRRKMAEGDEPLDWSAAEALAIASLAVEGHPVRLSGQDSTRGTFSQRHAVLHDVVDGSQYEIFQHLADDQASVETINSPLCEAGALGFEYGYSLDRPDALVVWEAQYGDFANAAQVVIDQFLASAEDKWRRLSGLAILLPHGFEGMGPEHSSARLERFLSLAAEDNLQIVCPTTPAQYFHVLRRQVLRRWRKPLVVLTPKSLLRRPGVESSLDQLADGSFRRVLGDDRDGAEDKTNRILLCSGKNYYDLIERREEKKHDTTAILRIEQFYPLSDALIDQSLQPYADDLPVVWVQEEPENMGAANHWRARFGERIDRRPLQIVARCESASPATGSKASHRREQDMLLSRAFGE
jgi:2-oxoglutarate dehydrogenase E1 component